MVLIANYIQIVEMCDLYNIVFLLKMLWKLSMNASDINLCIDSFLYKYTIVGIIVCKILRTRTTSSVSTVSFVESVTFFRKDQNQLHKSNFGISDSQSV